MSTHVRNPHLGPVQDIATIDLLSRSLHADNIRARGMFRHRQSTNLVTGQESRQEPLLLFRRSIQRELVDAKLGMRSV